MVQDPAGGSTPGGRGGRSVLRTLAHDIGNLASRLTFLSANLQSRLTDAAEREETKALLDDSTRRLMEIASRLREMDNDG